MTTTGHAPQALMTPREVCSLLHISRSTLTLWERNGQLAAVRHDNGHRRFLVESPAIVRQLAALAAARG